MDSVLQYMNDDIHVEQILSALHISILHDCLPIPILSSHECFDIQNDPYDEACALLIECVANNHTNKSKAERAIEIIEKHSLTKFKHIICCLVYFPDLLFRFLCIQKRINCIVDSNTLSSMFAMCIQHPLDHTVTANLSVSHLLLFRDSGPLEIKLLPIKYPIDEELYQLVRLEHIYDRYYDGLTTDYYHSDLVVKSKSGSYISFHDAYHCLLYGTKQHLQALIVYWDIYGEDITTSAAREFFKLPVHSNISDLQDEVNNMCLTRS